jgi:hypothetical protein
MQPTLTQSFSVRQVLGWDTVQPLLAGVNFSFKAVMNSSGIGFFSHRLQHRDMKFGEIGAAISYEDDSKGNALAVIFSAGRAEIRLHRSFVRSEVERLVSRVIGTPELGEFARSCDWFYGSELIRPRSNAGTGRAA